MDDRSDWNEEKKEDKGENGDEDVKMLKKQISGLFFLVITGFSACSVDNSMPEEEAHTQATSSVRTQPVTEPDATDTASALAPAPLSSADTHLVDIRGVGDTGWSQTHQSPAMRSALGDALTKFDPSGRYLKGDLSFMNFESVVGENCSKFWAPYNPGKAYAFISRPDNLRQAFAKGFNLVSLANNHTRDCHGSTSDGTGGINQSVANMIKISKEIGTDNPLLWHGVAASQSEISTVAVGSYTVKGKAIRIGFASVYLGRAACPLSACANDSATILKKLEKADVSLRILSIHTQGAASELQQVRVAKEFIEKHGGDIVFGHGPHVWGSVRALKKPNGKRGIVFDSLGNFIHPSLASQQRNLLGRVLLDPNTLEPVQVQVLPIFSQGSAATVSAVDALGLPANLKWRKSTAKGFVYANVKRAAASLAGQ